MDEQEIIKNLTNERFNDLKKIFECLPEDSKTCLDIGSGRDKTTSRIYEWLKKRFKTYTTLDVGNAEIIQDLNVNPSLKLKDNSYDIVILSNILEHIVDPIALLNEAKRVSSKYLLIGLPNEYHFDARIRFLLSINNDRIYPLGHKHRFSLSLCENLIKEHFESYLKRKYLYGTWGRGRFPEPIKNFLVNLKPSFFAGEVYYIVRK